MTSVARGTFDRLMAQVGVIEQVAVRAESDGDLHAPPALRRSGFVLAVAACDSYFHERAVPLLSQHARTSSRAATAVASYLRSARVAGLPSDAIESHVRLQLSFKTLVSPRSIDLLLSAAGLDAEGIWLTVALGLATRPDRLRRLQELLYDRRNQIAHEGDWDVSRLDFRPMERANLADCVQAVTDVVDGFEAALGPIDSA